MKNTQLALRINALFSASTGLLLLLFHGGIADIFAVAEPSPFWIVGIGLLFFAGTVYYESRQSPLRIAQVKSISLMDIAWVLGSILLIIWNPFDFSIQGKVLLGIIALIVGFFAFHQLYSIQAKQDKSYG